MINRDKIIRDLKTEKQELEKIIKEADYRIKNAPEGAARISEHGKGVQFFHRKHPSDKTGVYIPVSKRETAIKLIQKKYDQQIIIAARKQLKSIDVFLNTYDPDSLKKVFRSVNKLRKPFINAVELPDKEYAEMWQNVKYEGKSFSEDAAEHYTQKGERVRSKSEAMIADVLYRKGIPYRYEYPLKLGNKEVYPDFTILRMPDRREVYYEHFGLMDDTMYRNNALSKIDLYESNGILTGDRLFFTMETYKRPLNAKDINMVIQRFC